MEIFLSIFAGPFVVGLSLLLISRWLDDDDNNNN